MEQEEQKSDAESSTGTPATPMVEKRVTKTVIRRRARPETPPPAEEVKESSPEATTEAAPEPTAPAEIKPVEEVPPAPKTEAPVPVTPPKKKEKEAWQTQRRKKPSRT